MSRATLVHLETLAWIARLGSFSAAAQRLNTTQPAISKRVRDLEAALGIRLFQRQGRRMGLTIAGRDLVRRTQPVLAQLDDLVREPAHATGVVRLGIGEVVAATWLPRLMALLRQRLPGVGYEIEVGLTVNMRHTLETGGLDLAILAAPVDDTQLSALELGGVDLHWYVGAQQAAGLRGDRVGLREAIGQLPLWCVAKPSRMHPLAVEALRSQGIPPQDIHTSSSVQNIGRIVAEVAGLALLPECMVQDLLRDGRLVRLPGRLLPMQRVDFVAAYPRDQNQALVRQIAEIAQEASVFMPRGRRRVRQAG